MNERELNLAHNILKHTDIEIPDCNVFLEGFFDLTGDCDHKWVNSIKFVRKNSEFEIESVIRCKKCTVMKTDYEFWLKPLEVER